MATSIESKAVDAALNNRWDEAVSLNLQILKEDKENVEALSRLGRAYRAIGKDRKAAETFKKVLAIDSLNPLAQRNLEQLKNGTENHVQNGADLSGFVIEPGTTKKLLAHLDSRKIDPKKLLPGQKFTLEIKNDQVTVQNERGTTVGTVCEGSCPDFIVAKKIFHVHEVEATFLSVNKGPLVEMIARSPKPIFKGEKQEVNPEARFTVDEEVSE